MLVLNRKEGQWVEITHRSGEVLRIRVYGIAAGTPGQAHASLAFDDDARNFEIQRPERQAKADALAAVAKAALFTLPTELRDSVSSNLVFDSQGRPCTAR